MNKLSEFLKAKAPAFAGSVPTLRSDPPIRHLDAHCAARTFGVMAMLAVLLLSGVVPPAEAATDGTASFTVTMSNPPGNYSARVDAFWVTDSTGKFIQNVRKDAAARQQYLYRWAAVRTTTTIDGYSGATISTWTPVTVTWDCRDVNNVIVPDGTYRFYVEFTDRNGQGHWTTNGIPFIKGPAAVTNTYPDLLYIRAMKVVYTPAHDLAVTSLTPSSAPPDTNVTLRVTVTNRTATAESFTLTVSNLSNGTRIGSRDIASLAGNTATNVTLAWSTTNLLGTYSLQAEAGPVQDELVTTNNTLTTQFAVQAAVHDVGVLSLSPALVPPDSSATIQVAVTNHSSFTESLSVILSNATLGAVIGTQSVTALPGNTARTLNFTWDTAGLNGNYSLVASAGPVATETLVSDNSLAHAVTVRAILKDLAVRSILVPEILRLGITNPVTLTITNAGEQAESFTLTLADETEARTLGSQTIASLAPGRTTNVVFQWPSANSSPGYHTLRGTAIPLAGEGNTVDNTNSLIVPLAATWVTNRLVAKGAMWRFQDEGLDLTETPWKQANYYDAVWQAGPAPLGYCTDAHQTNITTLLGFGPNTSNKFRTYYFRTAFDLDTFPTSLRMNVRCDDGAVVYLNGSEMGRLRMPQSKITYTNFAASTVSGTNEYFYAPVNAPHTNLVSGRNVLAVEVHQTSATSSDIVLDLELLGITPVFTMGHDVRATGLAIEGSAVRGDNLPITVTLTNAGTATEEVIVLLKNLTTGQTVEGRAISGFYPGTSATVRFDWSTFAAADGANQLAAFTVVGGVTNSLGAYTNQALVSHALFSSNAVNAAGSLGGRCTAVASWGSALIVGAGATLQVWDQSKPLSPVLQGSVRLPGLIEHISVGTSNAFVACGKDGLLVVDLTNLAQPAHRLSYNTSGHAHGTAISGNYLYLADGGAGLRILSLAQIEAPTLAGVYRTKGPARAVAVVGSTACVLDEHEGLLLLNVADPAAPVLAGAFTGFDAGRALAAAGSRVFIVDANNRFYVVDTTSPASPSLLGSLLLPNQVGQAIVLDGSTAYVAAGHHGVLAIDVATPSAPALAATLPVPGEASALSIMGTNLNIAAGFSGFCTADTSPRLLLEMATGLRAADVAVVGSTVYVAGGESGLSIYSITNLAAPVLLGRFPQATNARSLAVSGSLAYVGDGQYGLKIVEVSDPRSPALIGSYQAAGLESIRQVGVSGSLVVVSDGWRLALLDVSTPTNPSLVANYQAPGFVASMAVADGKAYLACGQHGLVVLGLSAAGFNLVGTYSSPHYVSAVAVSGQRAYLAHPHQGWEIVDVSNPSAPAPLEDFAAQGPVHALAASSSTVTLATPTNALVMDVASPLTPVALHAFGPVVQALRVASTTTATVTAEEEAGLALFAHTGDVDGDTLPDWWEQAIVNLSLATNGPIRSVQEVRAGDDFDGDGASNVAEYMAGTSPTDAASRFVSSIQPDPQNGAMAVRWLSQPGKTYTVYKSTDLSAGFTVLKENIPATPPINTEADPSGDQSAYYIIGVR